MHVSVPRLAIFSQLVTQTPASRGFPRDSAYCAHTIKYVSALIRSNSSGGTVYQVVLDVGSTAG
jgi:hypothetical protein